MAVLFTVNGVDLSKYIKHDGLKWSRNDIEAPETGRSLDGVMHRGRVATKIRLDVTCRPLTSNELRIVLQAILPETVSVRYYDPQDGTVTRLMYANNNSVQLTIGSETGLWTGISFPLVEV